MELGIFEVNIPITITKKKGIHTSYCPGFDIYTQASTEKQAHINIEKAVRLFLYSCYEDDTLMAIQKENKIKPFRANTPEPYTRNKSITLLLPFNIAEHYIDA